MEPNDLNIIYGIASKSITDICYESVFNRLIVKLCRSDRVTPKMSNKIYKTIVIDVGWYQKLKRWVIACLGIVARQASISLMGDSLNKG
jgi:hypothetical protein